MSEVTRLLESMGPDDPRAARELLPLVYEELRRLATWKMKNERSDHTLQPTELVHEAYIRLVDNAEGQSWKNRGHFFAAAAEAMRRILIESARRKKTDKHGGKCLRVPLDKLEIPGMDVADTLIDIDESLSRLSESDPVAGQIVKLRLFAGLSVEDAGKAVGISRSTAYDNWAWAKAWIARDIDVQEKKSSP